MAMLNEQEEPQGSGNAGFDNVLNSQNYLSPAANPQFAIWSLMNTEALENIKHYLRGETIDSYDENDRPLWKQVYKPIVNEQGTFEVMRFLEGIVSKHTSLTKLDEEQALKDCRINSIAVARFLRKNGARFEINPASYRFLCNELNNFIEFAIMKAARGWYFEALHTETKDVNTRQVVEQPKPQGQGFWGILGLK